MYLFSFLCITLVEVSGALHIMAALPLGEKPILPTEYEAG
jgi:hypothetical protein